jgi:Transposase IS116/IS110/IS902 family
MPRIATSIGRPWIDSRPGRAGSGPVDFEAAAHGGSDGLKVLLSELTTRSCRDHFAACNGTAAVEVSSGNRTFHRLSLRENRRLNHAIHMAAVTQISHRHSRGRV